MGHLAYVAFQQTRILPQSQYLSAGGHTAVSGKQNAFSTQFHSENKGGIVAALEFKIGGIEHFHKDWLCRGSEIAKWLDDTFGYYDVFTGEVYSYIDEDCEYVILDDDVDMLMCQKDNFIHVDNDEALTEEDINKAIDIFERKNKK
jgi:hypothetical protein